ncbi:MAG TPA: hypothetical protein VGY56_18290 [Verrucomicrobiae bacterium]|nr:hypothetical protein [Verrucomicrobiae bacterium]
MEKPSSTTFIPEPPGGAKSKRLAFFERFLTVWVLLCVVVGVAFGKLFPDLTAAMSKLQFGQDSQVNVPIGVLLWLMVYPMMLKVDFQDLKKAGIPFLDERGRRVDYHALRTTFVTRLSINKVHPRLAMELARHSDLKLTMKNYTDAGQLPLREVIESLPGFGGRSDSRIDSRTLGASGQSVSPTVTKNREKKIENHIENTFVTHSLSP